MFEYFVPVSVFLLNNAGEDFLFQIFMKTNFVHIIYQLFYNQQKYIEQSVLVVIIIEKEFWLNKHYFNWFRLV